MTTPRKADEKRIGGRRYVRTDVAAQISGYSAEQVAWFARTKPDQVRSQRDGALRYVCLSDLLAYRDRQRVKRSKLSQVRAWWDSHPGQHHAIRTWHDLYGKVQRDGIQCSPATVRYVLAEVRPTIADVDRVIAWLEADPRRCLKSWKEIRQALLEEQRVVVGASMIKKAKVKYYRKHGHPEPAFDLAEYLHVQDAADSLGVTRGAILTHIRHGKLTAHLWRGTSYVLRSSFEEFCRERAAKLDGRYARRSHTIEVNYIEAVHEALCR